MKVQGNKLIDNELPVHIKGISLISIGDLSDPAAIVTEVKEIFPGINTVRLPVYARTVGTHCTKFPYVPGNKFIKQKLKPAVDKALELGLYAIIDWHAIDSLNHNTVAQAVEFWEEACEVFNSYDNVLFEIFNEPLNNKLDNNLEPEEAWLEYYTDMQVLIDTVRQRTDKVLIVGTPAYCRTVKGALSKPFDGDNLVYCLHAHPFGISEAQAAGREVLVKMVEKSYQVFDEIAAAKDQLPIILTEIGMNHNENFTTRILDAMNDVGWIAWVYDRKWWPSLLDDEEDFINLTDFGKKIKERL
jgi:hypothetical protein